MHIGLGPLHASPPTHYQGGPLPPLTLRNFLVSISLALTCFPCLRSKTEGGLFILNYPSLWIFASRDTLSVPLGPITLLSIIICIVFSSHGAGRQHTLPTLTLFMPLTSLCSCILYWYVPTLPIRVPLFGWGIQILKFVVCAETLFHLFRNFVSWTYFSHTLDVAKCYLFPLPFRLRPCIS